MFDNYFLRISTIVFTTLLFIFSACKKDDPAEGEKPVITHVPGTVTAEIDGIPFLNSGFRSVESDLHIDEAFNQFDLQIDAETEVNGIEDRITISIFGTDFATLKAGDVFIGGDVPYGAKRFDGDFYRISRKEGDDTHIICDSEQGPASTCTITAIDHEARLISGTFAFKAIDITDETMTFSITSGVFTEIPY